MKTMGTLSTFIEPMEGNMVVGRQIAAAGFLQALLAYSNFERIDFFLPNSYSCQFARSYFHREFGSENMGGRVRIFEHTQLPELLRRDRYDVFHLADFTTYLPALAHLRQNLARESFPITGLSASISEKGYLEHYFHMMLHGVQDFDGIICISRCVKEALEKSFRMLEQRFKQLTGSNWHNPIDLSIVPLAVDAGVFGQVDGKTARKKLDLPPDRKIILIFGRYSYADKMDLLPVVEIAIRLGTIFEKDPPLFVLAGSDPLHYGSLVLEYARRRGAESYFCLRSNIAPEDKPHYYAAADVFFSPADNLQESFGITILEAMASGLPVVGSDFNGYRELIENGKTGFCIPTYWGDAAPDIELLSGILFRNSHNFYLAQSIALDLDKASEALERLLNHPELRIEMGQAGRKQVEAKYNWKAVIGMHEELWNRLADKMRGRRAAPAPDPFEAPYYQLFSHYLTRSLVGEDQIGITEEGMRVMEAKASPPVYPELAAMISGEVLHHILVLCRRQGRSVAFLQEKLQSTRQTPPQTSLYHILWALKQGLVRLAME
jgi:glycosyltransferase involved in cell wall biosynthesis